jgi:AcrR family transcriptional regulator
MSATASDNLLATGAKRGRPRRVDADEAILGATLELLVELGAAGLSMDVLAQRAGVGKATIYRRWDSKEALILDAMRTANTPVPVPDEGNLRDDLFAYMDAVIERFGAGRGSDVLPHLIEASCHDEHLRASLDDYTLGRQATIRLLLQRGLERGELPADTDVDLLVDVILAPIFYRHLCTGAKVDQDLTHRLVTFALRSSAGNIDRSSRSG